MFLVVPRLDEHFGFDHRLFACRIGGGLEKKEA